MGWVIRKYVRLCEWAILDEDDDTFKDTDDDVAGMLLIIAPILGPALILCRAISRFAKKYVK